VLAVSIRNAQDQENVHEGKPIPISPQSAPGEGKVISASPFGASALPPPVHPCAGIGLSRCGPLPWRLP